MLPISSLLAEGLSIGAVEDDSTSELVSVVLGGSEEVSGSEDMTVLSAANEVDSTDDDSMTSSTEELEGSTKEDSTALELGLLELEGLELEELEELEEVDEELGSSSVELELGELEELDDELDELDELELEELEELELESSPPSTVTSNDLQVLSKEDTASSASPSGQIFFKQSSTFLPSSEQIHSTSFNPEQSDFLETWATHANTHAGGVALTIETLAKSKIAAAILNCMVKVGSSD